MAKDAMVYPQAIGVAATWDPDLARRWRKTFAVR